MKKKRRGLVDWQPVKEKHSGSEDAYSRYVASQDSSSGGDAANATDGTSESPLANPDTLQEQTAAPSSPQLLMGEAILHLQGRQKQAYLLVMREDRSMAEAGEILGIGKSSVQIYLDRAIKFITQYCNAAMKQGRV